MSNRKVFSRFLFLSLIFLVTATSIPVNAGCGCGCQNKFALFLLAPMLGIVCTPVAASLGFATNGCIQAAQHTSTAVKVAGALAATAVATDWATQRMHGISERVHKIIAYAGRLGGTGLVGYGAYKAFTSGSKVGPIAGGIGACLLGLGMVLYDKYDPSFFLWVDRNGTTGRTR